MRTPFPSSDVWRAIEAGLARTKVVQLSGVAEVVLAFELGSNGPSRTLIVSPDDRYARKIHDSLVFFGKTPSLLFPGWDQSPFVDVLADKQAQLDRASTLFSAITKDWRFFNVGAPSLIRKLPLPDAFSQGRMSLEPGLTVDRQRLIFQLSQSGYERSPVVDDIGTFAVRGALLDLFPNNHKQPVRIEFDGDEISSMRYFDPDSQRSLKSTSRIDIAPATLSILSIEDDELAVRIRGACDRCNYPSHLARPFVEDFVARRDLFRHDHLSHTIQQKLCTIFDFLNLEQSDRVVLVEPQRVFEQITATYDSYAEDYDTHNDKRPMDRPEDLLAEPAEIDRRLAEIPRILSHELWVSGQHNQESQSWSSLRCIDQPQTIDAGTLDGSISTIAKQPASHSTNALRAFVNGLLNKGERVVLCASTQTHAEQFQFLLSTSAQRHPIRQAPQPLPRPEDFTIWKGALPQSFEHRVLNCVFISDRDVFGEHTFQSRNHSNRQRKLSKSFLDDLRALRIDDFVVHKKHGVGRYLGLEKKTLPQSKLEQMQGVTPKSLEVLVIEYAADAKLYVPVTRLHQVQKYSANDGSRPRLDKLGGQTFARAKRKARQSVQKLADDLLRLYAERMASHRQPIDSSDDDLRDFEETFRFDETVDQQHAIEDVLQDLKKPHPMDRVVCGDVGFGKTEVAMRAAFRVAAHGRQVAILCPTTVLAQQHYRTFSERFATFPLQVAQLSRFVPKARQSEIIATLKQGTCDIIIGTHRILSKDVHFHNLGLLVVDEEQRFGVADKERIKTLRKTVDVLTLTATPIPRTLQMSIGGIRDLSIMKTPPADRRSVRTLVTTWDDRVLSEAIDKELSRNGQVFFVHNRIEDIYEYGHRIQQLVPNARIAVAHAQLRESALEKIMSEFVAGKYDILCSTAIVENGLDIPRANTIIIHQAERFGLSQLYQLRGRVGRSRQRAYCYLVTPPANAMTDEARQRVDAIQRCTELGSGFQLATLDMQHRGTGDLLGAEQSGNIASVGFELFMEMLQEAVATLKGQTLKKEFDPELSIQVEHYLPDDYVDDVGIRLSFYKRFSQTENEHEIQQLCDELEERFGPLPKPAQQLVEVMSLIPFLRGIHALGCEVTYAKIILHLNPETTLNVDALASLLHRNKSWKLSPDMKLSHQFTKPANNDEELIEVTKQALHQISQLK